MYHPQPNTAQPMPSGPAQPMPSGGAYPPGAPARTARPGALYFVLVVILLGSLLTFVDWDLDRRVLAEMFWASDEMVRFLPTFNTVRLVVSVLGVVVALGLLVLTFLRANWARVLLAVACFGYALVNLGAAAGAGITLITGRGAFNQGGDTTHTSVSLLNGLSLAIDLFLLLMVVICAVVLLTGRTRAYTRAGTDTR